MMRILRMWSRAPARYRYAGGVVVLLTLLITAGLQALAAPPGNESFQRTWERTDKPVLDGIIPRTWMWGPEANTTILQEPYADSPGGMRDVQYFDKSRMEVTNPNGDAASIWYVTNGLLVNELVSGNMQAGDDSFEQRLPAKVNVVGDQGLGVTYAAVGENLEQAAYAEGELIDTYYDWYHVGPGNSGYNVWVIYEATPGGSDFLAPILAYDVRAAHYVPETNHTIAAPFWEFMNSSGTVYEGGQFTQGSLFQNPYFATGFPISEPNWTHATVGGESRWVLFQCFERRCLTYTPGNSEGFVVEAGNVGQHYYQWRYANEPGEPTPTATATSTATAPDEPALIYDYVDQWGEAFEPLSLFNEPADVAIGLSGDVYIVEAGMNRVQKYASDGVYLTQWGVQGPGEAQFESPNGIAIDADSNVYVVDTNNHRVQKFDPNGAYITQWGTRGTDAEEFEAPQGIAISAAGTVYVADTGNDRVQLFSTSGTYISQFGGFGTDDGKFSLPRNIAIDAASGNLYVTDAFNSRVQKFDAAGGFLTKWGIKGTSESQFDTPQGIAVDSAGDVYVADFKNNRVQKFDASGNYLTQWGTPGASPGQFYGPIGLAVDTSDVIYSVEFSGGQIQKFDSQGGYLDRWYDAGRGKIAEMTIGLALDSNGNTYVTDIYHECLQVFDPSGEWVTGIGGRCNSDMALKDPVAAEATSDGSVYAVELKSGKIRKFTQAGEFVTEWGGDGTGNGQFDEPTGLAVDSDGNVYVADKNNNRIQKFTSSGLYITQWGLPGNRDGEFNHPFDIAIHGERVYVVDQDNFRVQVFDLDGAYLGQWGSFGAGDGQFQRPAGIAVDTDGYIYVTDLGTEGMVANPVARFQKFTPDGAYFTQIGKRGSGDGEFIRPYRVEVDAAGNVYVLDSGNYRVQKFVPVVGTP